MKKIISFICFIVLLVGLNSCTVYSTDDYVYTRTVYYPSYGVYYRPTPPPPPRYYHHKSHHKPKHHYNKPHNKPTQPHRSHNSRPTHNRNNNRR